jgi:hypothetical protein
LDRLVLGEKRCIAQRFIDIARLEIGIFIQNFTSWSPEQKASIAPGSFSLKPLKGLSIQLRLEYRLELGFQCPV